MIHGYRVDDRIFTDQDEAERYAERTDLVILDWFPEDGLMVADYEYDLSGIVF